MELGELKQIVLIFLKHLQLLNDLRCHNQAKPETYLSPRTLSVGMISQALSRMMPPLLDLPAQPPNQVNPNNQAYTS